MQVDIELADLSAGGCRIEDPQARLRLGEIVRLFIAGTGPHMAEVAWRQGGRVGLEFQRDLPERVIRKLAAADWEGARRAMAEERSSAVVGVRRIL
jgi:hypothetical protein